MAEEARSIPRSYEILAGEAARTERVIAWARLILTTLLLMADGWGYFAGEKVYGYAVPLSIPAVDGYKQ